MAISTTTEKNSLATKYGADAPYAALFTSAPSGGTPGTEVTGSGYARQALSWGAASNGVITASASFTVPSGQTVLGAGLYSAVSAGTYVDGGSLTSFAGPGTYTLSVTYTQV